MQKKIQTDIQNSLAVILLGLRDMVFPILWIAEGIDEISDMNTVNLLKTAIFTPERAKNAL